MLLWLAALAIIAAAVGTAFTAANNFDTHAGNQLGYGTQTVSGAHVTSMHYTLSADGTTVDTVTFVAAGDLTLGVPTEHGFVGFTVASVPGPTVDCGTGILQRHLGDDVHLRRDGTGPGRGERPVDRHRGLQLAIRGKRARRGRDQHSGLYPARERPGR